MTMTLATTERHLLDAFLLNGWPMTEEYIRRHCIHCVCGDREIWLHDGLVFLVYEGGNHQEDLLPPM